MPLKTRATAADAYRQGRSIAGTVRAEALDAKNRYSRPTISRAVVALAAERLATQRNTLQAIANVPALNRYVKDQLGDQAANFTGELAAIAAAADAVIAEIVSIIPKAQNTGEVLLYVLNANGSVTESTFDTADLASLSALEDTLAATVDESV